MQYSILISCVLLSSKRFFITSIDAKIDDLTSELKNDVNKIENSFDDDKTDLKSDINNFEDRVEKRFQHDRKQDR